MEKSGGLWGIKILKVDFWAQFFCLSLKSGESVEFLFVLTVAALRGLLKIEGPGMACGGVDIDV